MTERGLLAADFIGALLMTAVIWFVQLVQYPMFARIGPGEFAAYSQEYQQRISWIVVGPMLLEVAATLAIAAVAPRQFQSLLFCAAAILLAVVWASTFFWQVPLHEKLLRGYDLPTIQELVRSNWIRTIAWTGRAIVLGILIWRR